MGAFALPANIRHAWSTKGQWVGLSVCVRGGGGEGREGKRRLPPRLCSVVVLGCNIVSRLDEQMVLVSCVGRACGPPAAEVLGMPAGTTTGIY